MRKYGLLRVLRDLVVMAVGVLVMLVGFAYWDYSGIDVGSSAVKQRGVAVARECVPGGLFGPGTLGWWETCAADVRWSDGTVERAEFEYSQLTSANVGREVEVVKRRIFDDHTEIRNVRADFEPPHTAMVWVLMSPVLLGMLTVVIVCLRWWRSLRPQSLEPVESAGRTKN